MLSNLGSENENASLGVVSGIWKYDYEALILVKCLQFDKYYDNIKYFDLIYTIMNKDKNIIIASEDFEYINELTK